MKQTIRQHWLAISVVIVAAIVVAACGQVTTSEEAPSAGEVRAARPKTAQLVQADVCVDGDPACTPTGAHAKHTTTCAVCHAVAGRLSFQLGGPAYGANWTSSHPRPTFDATAKTCSNVACHGMQSGSFSYYFPGGDGEPALNTVNIAGSAGRPTPSWYATGAMACSACHDNPPRNGSDGSNVWHSGSHANQGSTGAANQCQFCHPDITGSGGVGTGYSTGNCMYDFNGTAYPVSGAPAGSFACKDLHANGVFNVYAKFVSSCFGCH